MNRCTLSLFVPLLLAAASAADLPPPPDTPKVPVADTYHGVTVIDNYRWMENAGDPAVQRWSKAENARTRAYLDSLPQRPEILARVDQLIRSNSISYQVQLKRGGKLFAYKSDPRLQQPLIVTLGSPDDLGSERAIVDPNALSASGQIAIDWFSVSLDGKMLAVSLSRGGSEAGDLHLYDVATGRETGEVIPHVQNGTAGGSMAFAPGGGGFWYTRYPRGNERPPADAGLYQQVWFHRIGTATETDTYEIGRDFPKIAEIELHEKEDGRWIMARVANGDGGEAAYYLRATEPGSPWIEVSKFSDRVVDAQFGADDALYLMSRADAPRGKILRLALDGQPALARAVVIVKESEGAIESFLPAKSLIYVNYLAGGPSRVGVFDLAGGIRPDVPILPVSAVSGLVRMEGDDILFVNGSYLKLPATYRYSAQAGTVERTAMAMTSIADYSDCEVVRDFARSKDGTMVPLNIIRRKGTRLDGNNPTILYAYGGYGLSMQPAFSASTRIWLEQGGVYVIANIRGGGEYGDQWHLDGNLLKKQNDYDDFYACACWLIDKGYTLPARLGIMGGSNGGLLMGAALTQHPELYRAVVSMVGIYDMLRVELTQNGAFNVTEYGTVKDPSQFNALFAYSPYHRVVDGVRYPAVLLTTGANDPRVDPWHSRKFCARLQAATSSPYPVLLRTSDAAGHGIGSSLAETIALRADAFTFLIHELGVDYRPSP
ncbi:MAG: prolyl oligopeptidase family serine peptidase [Opitutaceae bacterium]